MSQNEVKYTTIETPIGTLLLTADATGLCGVYMESHKGGPKRSGDWGHDDAALAGAAEQLAAYFDGGRREFDLPLSMHGTPFQQRAWRALCEVPFGQTWTYAELARRIGAPRAVRAVGAAVGRNPISIIVPCHRIVGSDGSLTGFGGGLPRKRWLLEHEGVALDRRHRGKRESRLALSSR
jgi:methylated-DNA-[protein]-cysteine S-methyltransferase